MNIGLEIQQIRKKNNLTQIEFANKINISRGALINYEKGKRIPPLKVLQSISNVFGIDLNYLSNNIPVVDSKIAENLISANQATLITNINQNNDSNIPIEFINFLKSIGYPNTIPEKELELLLKNVKEYLSYEFFKLGYLPITPNIE